MVFLLCILIAVGAFILWRTASRRVHERGLLSGLVSKLAALATGLLLFLL